MRNTHSHRNRPLVNFFPCTPTHTYTHAHTHTGTATHITLHISVCRWFLSSMPWPSAYMASIRQNYGAKLVPHGQTIRHGRIVDYTFSSFHYFLLWLSGSHMLFSVFRFCFSFLDLWLNGHCVWVNNTVRCTCSVSHHIDDVSGMKIKHVPDHIDADALNVQQYFRHSMVGYHSSSKIYSHLR